MHKELNHERVFIAGHKGMVGSAIMRVLTSRGFSIVTAEHNDLELTNQEEVRQFFEKEKPSQVYIAAARVGGIYANNTYPGEFIYQNLMLQANIIDAAFRNGVKKLLFLGSSCIYPRLSSQPMLESELLTGRLEPTNEPYAIAKIAGIKLCESYNRQYGVSHGIDYRSIMPTNLYGPGDNYHIENSHVIPALIRRFHEAKINNIKNVVIWGTGSPKREFLYVDDAAESCVHLMNIPISEYSQQVAPMMSHINVGTGEELTIRELAELVSKTVGYSGKIDFDSSKPDGSPRKLLDNSKIKALGWTPRFDLKEGLKLTYIDYVGKYYGN
jgi:GDP-L-fucose synthase